MNILGLETSTEACSVALINAENDIFSEFDLTPRQHTRFLPIMLDKVLMQSGLRRNDIDVISFASGPGAFTGVRIAAATAQGLAIGLNKSMLAISSLAVLAQQTCDVHGCKKVLASLDARMGEVYSGLYQLNPVTQAVELQHAEQLIKLEHVKPVEGAFAAGSGFKAWSEAGFKDSMIEAELDRDIYPTAHALVKLASQKLQNAEPVSPEQVKINYIRNKVAEKKTVVTG